MVNLARNIMLVLLHLDWVGYGHVGDVEDDWRLDTITGLRWILEIGMVVYEYSNNPGVNQSTSSSCVVIQPAYGAILDSAVSATGRATHVLQQPVQGKR